MFVRIIYAFVIICVTEFHHCLIINMQPVPTVNREGALFAVAPSDLGLDFLSHVLYSKKGSHEDGDMPSWPDCRTRCILSSS
jgi:hypothetical protein